MLLFYFVYTIYSGLLNFRDVAFPPAKKLKEWIKSLLTQVKLLEGKVKEPVDYKSWLEKKIEPQARESAQKNTVLGSAGGTGRS